MLKVQTGIDTLGIRIEKNDKTELNILLESILSIFSVRETRIINDSDLCAKVVWYSNKRLAIISTGGYPYLDIETNETLIKHYINISFIGLKRHIKSVDEVSYRCIEEVFGNLNVFNVKYKITELDIYTDINCSMDNLLVLCNDKMPKTKYHPLDTKFYNGNTVYVEDIPPGKVSDYIRRSYMYNKAIKEDLRHDMSRFEIKLQKPFFVNKVPSLINIWNTMSSYSFLYFSSIKEKQDFIDKYNSYSNVRKSNLKTMGINKYKIEMEVNNITNTIYYLENYKVPVLSPGMIGPATAFINKARKLERELHIHNTITKCIIKVMDSVEHSIMLGDLIDVCISKIAIEHNDLNIGLGDLTHRVREIVLKGNY